MFNIIHSLIFQNGEGKKMAQKSAKVALGAIIIVVTMLVAAFPLCSENAQAAIPVWEEGDKWALSGEKDIGELYDSMESYLLDSIGQDLGVSYVTSLDLKHSDFVGNASINMIFEVIEVTNTEYHVEVSYSGIMDLSGAYSASGKFVAPGSYITYYYNGYYGGYYDSNGQYRPVPQGNYYDYELEALVAIPHENYPRIEDSYRSTREVTMDMTAIAGAYGTATIVIDRGEMGIKKVETSATSYTKGSIKMTNYPYIEYIESSDPKNFDSMVKLEYKNYDLSWDGVATGTLKTVFSNPANFIPDPVEQGDIWEVQTTMTNSGTYGGNFDVSGLSSKDEEKIFTDGLAQYGLTGFPIDIGNLLIPDSTGRFENGKLEPISETMDVEMTCLRIKNYNDPIAGNIEVAEVTQYIKYETSAPAVSLYYCPESGRIVRIDTTYNAGGIGLNLRASSVSVEDALDAHNAAVKQVETRSDVTITASDIAKAQQNEMLTYGLVATVVATLVVVSAVFMMRKKRAAPPSPPLQ